MKWVKKTTQMYDLMKIMVLFLLMLNSSLESTKMKWFSPASRHVIFILTSAGGSKQILHFKFWKMPCNTQNSAKMISHSPNACPYREVQ